MKQSPLDLDDYLNRVNCSDEIQATESGLTLLQRAQLFTIPFENFDIILGRGISVEPAAICDKLLRHARGGYCFELNGLFLMALQALGFDARAILARVHLTGQVSGRGHQLSVVNIRGRNWIADVGFGRHTIRGPLLLEMGQPTKYDGVIYQLLEVEPWGVMLQVQTGGSWQDLYSFDLGHVCDADIQLGNHFTSTHPSSFFTHTRTVSLHSADGLATLIDTTLKLESNRETREIELPDSDGYVDALRVHFGIELDASHEHLVPESILDLR